MTDKALKLPRASVYSFRLLNDGKKRKIETSSSKPKYNDPSEIAKKRRTLAEKTNKIFNRPPPVRNHARMPLKQKQSQRKSIPKKMATARNGATRGTIPMNNQNCPTFRRNTVVPTRSIAMTGKTPKSARELETCQQELSNLKVENRGLECDVQRYTESHEFQDDLLKENASKITKLDELLARKETESNEAKANAKAMISLLRKTVAEKDTEIEKLQQKEKSTRVSCYKMMKEKGENLSKVKEENSSQLHQSQQNEILLQEKITSLEQINNGLRSKVSRIEEDLLKSEESISQLKRKQKQTNADFEDQIESQDSAFRRKLKVKDSEIEELKDDVSSLEKKIKSMTNTLRERDDEIASLNTNMDSQCRKLQQANADILTKSQLLSRIETDLQRQTGVTADRDSEIVDLNQSIEELKKNVSECEEKSREDEQIRKKLHNTIQELKGNIRVYCRVRPSNHDIQSSSRPSSDDADEKDHDTFVYPENTDQRSIEAVGRLEDSHLGGGSESKRWLFSYDRVFKPWEQQSDVFEEISQLVQSSLDGYKVCIFAYGQTGSGKTYTMEGPSSTECFDDKRGMIPRSVDLIFQQIEIMKEKGWTFRCKVMFLEIYNQNLRDLLSTKPPSAKLEIKHGKNNTTSVTNLQYVNVNAASDVFPLLKRANANRAVGRTDVNAHSSRSHSVFQVTLNGSNDLTNQRVEGILNLIDLAGSERLKSSHSTGDRLKEAQAINKSLSALGDVISALNNREKHVPYRNSRLTYLLQNCFGGDSKTLMFVNLSPEINNLPESVCSLRFASKVNSCQIGTAHRNVKFD